MENLVFCNDGIMRLSREAVKGKPILVPVSFLQEFYGNIPDHSFWFRWGSNRVIFEDGLTFGKAIECLEPWSGFFSDYLHLDITSYLKEMRKLHLVKDESAPFDWIGVTQYINMGYEVDYEHEEGESLEDFFSRHTDPLVLPKFKMDESTHLSGYNMGEEEHYSVDGVGMEKLANIPLYLNKRKFLVLTDFFLDSKVGSKNFNQKNFGKRSFINKRGFGVSSSGNITYMVGEADFPMLKLLSEMFLLFDYSPIEREERTAKIMAAVAEFDDYKNNEVVEDEPSTQGDIKVEIMPGAFDDVKAAFMDEVEFWENLVSAAKKRSKMPLKIGIAKEGIPPENRIFNTFDNSSEN